VIKLKKIFLFFITSLAVFLLGGCSFFSNKNLTDSSESQKKEQQQESFSGTLKEAMMKGIPLKCTWNKDNKFFGTGYLKGKNYYAEMNQEGKEGFLLMKENCMWMWDKVNPQGIKTCFEDTGEDWWESENTDSTGAPPADMQYNCVPAVILDSRFDLPTNVNFMTIEEMMSGQGQ